jgi:hypothetical protein
MISAGRQCPFAGERIHSVRSERGMSNRGAEPTAMFSEYFRDELLSQMTRAAGRGAKAF